MDYRKFNTLRSFGIEIEVGREVCRPTIIDCINKNTNRHVRSSFYHPSVNNSFWDVKLDGSCGAKFNKGINEGGYEITSFKGSGVNDLIHIAKTIANLKKINVKTNENCGFHIHVDVSDFNIDDIGILINNWLCIEYVMFFMVPWRRKFNKYCAKITNSKKNEKLCITSQDYWSLYKPNNTSLNNSDRKFSLNLVNFYRSITLKSFKRKTVEFRFPESTLVEKNIKNWTRFLVYFVEYVYSRKIIYDLDAVDNVSNFLSFVGLEKSSKVILSEGLEETRDWVLRKLRRHSCGIDFKKQADSLIGT